MIPFNAKIGYSRKKNRAILNSYTHLLGQ
jgi:hypothetical protein